jgi:hypothetical protein
MEDGFFCSKCQREAKDLYDADPDKEWQREDFEGKWPEHAIIDPIEFVLEAPSGDRYFATLIL